MNAVAMRAKRVVLGDRAAQTRHELRESVVDRRPGLFIKAIEKMEAANKRMAEAMGATWYRWEENR
jgi:hypothetical protein